MRSRRYLQLDVFADRPGAGNPLGVILDATGLDGTAMQAIAAWLNLSETIFFLAPSSPRADYHVRIFTPRRELPFAGHPSVGAAWAAVETGLCAARDGALVQECAAGLLPVRIERVDGGHASHVRSPHARRDEPGFPPSLLDAALRGLARGSQAPALWNNGPGWWLAELADAAAVRTMVPDLAAIAALTTATGAVGLAVYGRARGSDHALAARAFCPADGIAEDPVTGSANAAIAAQLHAAGTLPGEGARGYVASQGRELGRDGRVQVQVDDDGEVWIGGSVQPIIDGQLYW
jgi:PhzF family phenazine biosynthesis protein